MPSAVDVFRGIGKILKSLVILSLSEDEGEQKRQVKNKTIKSRGQHRGRDAHKTKRKVEESKSVERQESRKIRAPP